MMPVQWTGPSLNVETGKIATETLELAHHGFLEQMGAAWPPIEKAELEICEPQKSDKTFKIGAPSTMLRLDLQPEGVQRLASGGLELQAARRRRRHRSSSAATSPGRMKLEMFVDEHREPARPGAAQRARHGADCSPPSQPTEKSVQSGRRSPDPQVLLGRGQPVHRRDAVASSATLHDVQGPTAARSGPSARSGCTEFKRASIKQNPTSGGRRARRSHEVVLGDTLMSVAYRSTAPRRGGGRWPSRTASTTPAPAHRRRCC